MGTEGKQSLLLSELKHNCQHVYETALHCFFSYTRNTPDAGFEGTSDDMVNVLSVRCT